MDFAGLLVGHAGVSEALALPVFEMVTFGCGGSATLPSSLSGSPLPSFSPLSFPAGVCGAAFSSPGKSHGHSSQPEMRGTLDTTDKMGKRIDRPGRRQVKGT